MSTNPIGDKSTEVKAAPQHGCQYFSPDEPDYLRYEELKRELSDDLTPSEYTNAVRRSLSGAERLA